jgi:hypothetical protein
MNLLTENKKIVASNKPIILENLKLAKQYADKGELSKEDLKLLINSIQLKIYDAASLTSTGAAAASFNVSAATNIPSIGRGTGQSTPYTFYGEIYELLVFTQSLYDLDNTGGLITQIYNNQLSYTGT